MRILEGLNAYKIYEHAFLIYMRIFNINHKFIPTDYLSESYKNLHCRIMKLFLF